MSTFMIPDSVRIIILYAHNSISIYHEKFVTPKTHDLYYTWYISFPEAIVLYTYTVYSSLMETVVSCLPTTFLYYQFYNLPTHHEGKT